MTITADAVRALAFEALTDPRTVRRAYAGERVSQLARARIARALVALRARGHTIPNMPAEASTVGRA